MLAAFLLGSLTALVNPFVGTGGTGHCTPCAAFPFGMVQPGADTGNAGWEHCSGYDYRDDRVIMLSNTHLSGTGSSGLGDVGLFPFAGKPPAEAGSAFSHAREAAAPGYYSVWLDDVGVKAESTCSERVAYHRFSGGRPVGFLLDPNYGILSSVAEASCRTVSATRIVGTCRMNGWVNRTFHFVLESSAPLEIVPRPPRAGQKSPVFACMSRAKTLVLRLALSAASVEGASRNLAAEGAGFDFDAVRRAADAAWEKALARLTVPDGLSGEAKTNAYTCLYHLCVQPNLLSDVGEPAFYTTFSLWDTYRAAHPLYTLLYPERVEPFVRSLLEQGRRTGFMPIWTLWGLENQGMIGVHSVPVVVDAFLKGFGGVDWAKAYEQIRETLTRTGNPCPWKARWDLLDCYGYYPCDQIRGESVSRLLEVTFDFWCAAEMAEKLGRKDDAALFRRRAGLWKNVYDVRTGFMRGRTADGGWRTPYDPFAIGHNVETANDFTEGNGFQWSWHVLHDPAGLFAAMGGVAAAERKLDALFAAESKVCGEGVVVDVTGLIGQYVHGNEPSHHIPYLYALMGRPEKTDSVVKEVFRRFYRPQADGLSGNDDCGQMSAWYLFSALGLYPVNPCGGEYVLATPQLPQATLSLPGGRTLSVVTTGCANSGRSDREVRLNGRRLVGRTIRHADLVAGGELVFDCHPVSSGHRETRHGQK